MRKLLVISILFLFINSDFSNHGMKISAKTDFTKLTPLGVMATAVDTKIALSWEAVEGADGYEIYEAMSEAGNKTKFVVIGNTDKCLLVLNNKKRGTVYYYYIRAYKIDKSKPKNANNRKIFTKTGKEVSTTVAPVGKSTVKNFLQTAISPIGSTMYVWGGGWGNDSKAGESATRIGLSDKWRSFCKKQTSSYNYRKYLYRNNDGLDCSGFVGWTIYNVMNTKNNKKGYVYFSREQAEKLADLGFGTYVRENNVKNYKAGDIMSATCTNCGECRHVWIVIGECEDGSVVLVHSSVSGVQISGTYSKDGKKKSMAYKLAKKYMEKYYPSWTKKYPVLCKDEKYLTHFSQMRWTTEGKNAVLSDPDGYRNMSVEEVLEDLFAEGE